jgi:hypothetical protein
MLDAVSLDQLRTFIAAVDEGSFSAAARKLLRAQSVVSETISGYSIALAAIPNSPRRDRPFWAMLAASSPGSTC